MGSNMKPADPAGKTSRISPTAPASKSPSTNVWRLLEQDPRFRDGMDEARQDFDAGRVAPFRPKHPRPAG